MRAPVLLLSFLVLAPLVAAAHTESQRYVAGPEIFQASVNSLNVGGASFTPRAGETRVTITIVDDVAGPGVGAHVCQHVPNDTTTCGDQPGENDVSGCSPLTLDLATTGRVTVWVGSATTAVVGCTLAPAVRGEITAAFE